MFFKKHAKIDFPRFFFKYEEIPGKCVTKTHISRILGAVAAGLVARMVLSNGTFSCRSGFLSGHTPTRGLLCMECLCDASRLLNFACFLHIMQRDNPK
jgi:hypothetical protein